MANSMEMPPVTEIEAEEARVSTAGEEFFIASQWNLMWWKFKRSTSWRSSAAW